jgi:hypothetical protein
MAEELGPAVAMLQRKLDEQIQQVADTKRTINMLLKMSGRDAIYLDAENERRGTVRADQFYGKALATAVGEYLDLRKEACQPEEILRALQDGGFDFDVAGWKEDDRLRSLAISLAKNTGEAGRFHRLKNGTFGLRGWYDPDFLKKAASGAAETQAAKTRKHKGSGNGKTGKRGAKVSKVPEAEKPEEEAKKA